MTDVSGELLRILPANKVGYRPQTTNIAAESATKATVSTFDGRLFVTENGGHNWREVESPCAGSGLPSPGKIMGMKGNSHLWMADGADSIEGFWGDIFEQQDDRSWVRHSLPDFAMADALYASDSQVFAAGALVDPHRGQRKGSVLYSSDGGNKWSLIYQNESVVRIYAVAAISPNHIWAAGDNGLVIRLENHR